MFECEVQKKKSYKLFGTTKQGICRFQPQCVGSVLQSTVINRDSLGFLVSLLHCHRVCVCCRRYSGVFPSLNMAVKRREQTLQDYKRLQSKVEKYEEKEKTGPVMVKLHQVLGSFRAGAAATRTCRSTPPVRGGRSEVTCSSTFAHIVNRVAASAGGGDTNADWLRTKIVEHMHILYMCAASPTQDSSPLK